MKSKLWILFFLVFIFMMPGISAYWMYTHPSWLSGNTTNKGRLLSPPLLVNVLDDQAKWRLILWNPGPCQKNCRQQLNKLSRIRVSLGRRFYNLQLLWMTDDEAPRASRKTMKHLHAQAISFIGLDKINTKRLKNDGDSRIFIANPQNYLILSYPLNVDPADIYNDLQRLMK